MSEDVQRVLKILAVQPGGVSVPYLATRLGIHRRRVVKIINMLERAGYAEIRLTEHVVLALLTTAGIQQATTLGRAERETIMRDPLPTLMRISGAGVMVILVGFMWWWLDLFPQANRAAPTRPILQPALTAQAPVAVVSSPTNTPVQTPSGTAPIASATVPPPTPDETATPIGPGVLPTAIPLDTPDPWYGAIPTPVPLQEQPADTVNIVLMGADSSSGSWRTDTLIVVSVDPRLPSVSMLSIPRDLYVYIPGWTLSRINTADFRGERVGYPGGGPGLVKATIEYNLGIRVHFFARVDFQGFVNIVDTLGGVDVIVDCELHDTFPDPAAAGGRSDIDLLPGAYHLDGKQALWYARSRWSTSDFDRGRRQQRVLRGALAQIKQLELLPKLPELWDDLTATVQTDLTLETALWLAGVAGRMNAETAIKSRFIDNTVVRSWRSPEGAAVLLPDYDRIGPLVAEALAPPDTARARQGVARVEVLNGTTWDNWALLAADRLLWEGFDVVSIDRADASDYQQTTIIDAALTEKGSPVNYLAEVLQVGDANIERAETPQDGVEFRVVVGYDYRPCYRSYWRTLHSSTPTP